MRETGLRLLTYNLHKGFGVGNFRFVLHELRREIERLGCDIVCLQEVQGEHHHHRQRFADWPDEAQFEFLADRLWPHHVYGRNAVYPHGHHGNAILSRYPFEHWENLNVSPFAGASRSILHGVVRTPHSAVPLHVMCVHFGLTGAERYGQVSALLERIRAHVPAGEGLLIAGDFNDWRGSAGHRMETSLGVREVFRTLTGRHARSFPAWMPVLPVDRVYARGLVPHHCERMSGAPWRSLSDHLPLLCEFHGTGD